MFPSWRLKLRAAQVALDEGRCEEASKLLSRESLREFLPAKRLSQELAQQLLARASRKIAMGNSGAGWHDLRQVERLAGSEQLVDEFRQEQARRGLATLQRLLECGEIAMAEGQIAKLEEHRLGGAERRLWKKIVQWISQAKSLAYAGEFLQASEALTLVERLLPPGNDSFMGQIRSRRAKLEEDARKFPSLVTQLHDALGKQTWTEVLTRAEAVLELAPEHTPALAARRQAWKAVGLAATGIRIPPRMHDGKGKTGSPLARSTLVWRNSANVDTMTTDHQPGTRLIAWIDEIGGFLFCFDEEVLIGQPTGEGGIHIPVRADLSRRHASIRRDKEHYVLTPIHTTRINGELLTGPMVLRNQALIELGDSLMIRFTKPHTLSATAVLRVESKHKTEPAVDAILLMSESCVLGPAAHSHILCPSWKNDLVLFRRGTELHFRAKELVEFNEYLGATTGIITPNCRMSGDDFALSFEQI